MIKQELNKYLYTDITNIIMSYKTLYENMDKYNKVVSELQETKRSNPDFTIYFEYVTSKNVFRNIFCKTCGELCLITYDGAKCNTHGYLFLDELNFQLIMMNSLDLSVDEKLSIINGLINIYDYD